MRTQGLQSETAQVVLIREQTGDTITSQAHFLWPYAQPTDTYTVTLSPDTSIDFDTHFPVRPSVIRTTKQYGALPKNPNALANQRLNRLIHSPHLGMYVVDTALDTDTRLALARLQLYAPDTPEPLRQSCQAIVEPYETDILNP